MDHQRSTWRRKRGFTLVEVSIVVVCVGILAALALVGYIRYRRTARMSEATNLVSMIKSEQEAYKAEKGLYASVSKSSDAYYPATNPGAFVTAWGADCESCNDPRGWQRLNVRPSAPVMYGYATVAGVGADVTNSSSSSGGPDFFTPGGGGGTPEPASGDNDCASIAPTQPYFLIKAKGDTDGDGVAATVLALSCSNQVIVTNAGE
jgi:type IV pilus assembly protein PilA